MDLIGYSQPYFTWGHRCRVTKLEETRWIIFGSRKDHANEVVNSIRDCAKFMNDFESTSNLFMTWDETKAIHPEVEFLANMSLGEK